VKEELIMAPNLLFYQFLVVALVLICLVLHVWWPDDSRTRATTPLKPDKPRRKRSREPKPFTGLIHKPLCEACEQGGDARPKAPGSPPPVIVFTRGRRRTVDTRLQFCPDPDCAYFGWLERGNLRANGHPGSQTWRQLQCISGEGYFSETTGTIFHGKRASPDLIVQGLCCINRGNANKINMFRFSAKIDNRNKFNKLGYLCTKAVAFRLGWLTGAS
jgi:hypothetical protein